MTGDPKQYTANIYNWLKTKFTNTATDTKMDGTQSAGTSNLIARADHVHPTDTSRASSDHVHGDITNDGKVGSAANKPLITGTAGLVGAGAFEDTSSNIQMDGTAGGGSLNTFARGDHVHPTDTSRAPVAHASANTDYGVGSASNYGHVKVDAAPTSSSTNAVASGGVDSALALKQNEVETQSKIVGFTNKDRIDISRLLNYMENGSSNNYYTLKLEMGMSQNDSTFPTSIHTVHQSDVNNKLATDNRSVYTVMDWHVLFAAMIYKNGTAQTSDTTTITFKLLDGTVIGTSSTKGGSNGQFAGYTVFRKKYGEFLPSGGGIFYFYAEATFNGSVVKSNIISVFVKENQNLLSYNQWSCGDYTNDLTDFEQVVTSKITNEYSTQGENSVQIGRTSTDYWVDIPFTVPSIGEYTAQLKLRGKYGYMRIMRGETVIAQVGTPQTNEWKTVSLTANITNLTDNHIRVLNYNGDIFIDDVSLTSS